MTTPDVPEVVLDPIQTLKKAWWVLLLFGLFSVGFGIALLVWPGQTITVVATIFGLLMIISGALRFVAALLAEGVEHRWLYVIGAIVGVVLGVLVMKYPEQTIALVVLITALYWLIAGLIEFFVGIANHYPDRTARIAFGAISMVFGILVLVWPAPTVLVFAILAGIYAIIIGVLEIIAAFTLKSA